MKYSSHKGSNGFTLVEMIVSLGIFTVVLFLATSAFLSIVNADRKSRATRIAIDNLSLALEDMTRKIKTGTTYYCNTTSIVDTTATPPVGDCPNGGSTLWFMAQDGTTRIGYYLDSGTGSIWRRMGVGPGPGQGAQQITSPEITITGLNFIVSGSKVGLVANSGDSVQPMVIITIKGSIGANLPINLQATVTQRAYDN